MKKKLITAVLLLTVSLIAACGSSAETGDAKEASTEGSTEAATETSETAMVEEKSDLPYAEAQGLSFSKLEPVSLDYTTVIIDADYNEIKDNPRNYVVEKGMADYLFSDVITYPADQEGYTIAEISYSVDVDSLYHRSTLDDFLCHKDINTPAFFDYYSGKYIPEANISNGKGNGEKTSLTYEDKTWEIEASYTSDVSDAWNLRDYVNNSQYEQGWHNFAMYKITVTYPDDYDGLCFVLSKKQWEYNSEGAKKHTSDDYIGYDPENVGKNILDISDYTSKDDDIFYTMHDSSSVIAKAVKSADDVAPKTYGDTIGLQLTDSIDDISLPYKFFVINGSAGVLDESEAPVELGTAKYIIGEVRAEDIGDGNTKITIPYKMKYEADIDMSNSDAYEIENRDSIYSLESFDTVTGSNYSVEFNDGFVDNSEWGDWGDDNHIVYHGDIEVTSEVTVPTEKLDTVCLIIGNRYGKPGTDYVAFNVDTALAHK